MENNINERVAELVKSLKISTNAFAKTIHKSQSAVSFIIDGRSKPGFEILDAICETHMVNPTWLLTGKGEMFLQSEAAMSPSIAPDQYLQDQVKHLEDSFSRLANQLEIKDKQIEVKDRQIEKLMDLLGKPKDVAQVKTARIKSMYPVQETVSLLPEKEALIA